ncbi:NDxxF motif lipoprotein [Staphylococcus haemolyticus]|uniref:NDxxF motif lipoprotein n=2 Tax=Staphylococcus haemolyticus TaxID=1283 RepID=UPI000D1E454B|nr:NDxxF motif lipoprotein [Staphylococcus haemolyticus]MCE4987477.1 NDxxF motif lipoprotein [Staphylococcus haemolyticus]MCE5050187.1 NDxxF motif lipoprotein [Staphylococcus haemolyticus]PTK42036.1 NDxxF motif lipoprotein [Staphylococcus haemolyticus]PTK82644.1 NDxxF motif lipoprotein [Staphylococcus haemolyticus]PTL02094.1 NDxxF motif lipoprotein [Staphylococcus haemolyticus]
MKKFILFISTLVLTLSLVGCSSSSEENDSKDTSNDNKQSQNSSKHNDKIPKHIFDKTTKDQKISESTIKKDIKTYLDTDRKLIDAREPYEEKLESGEKLSKKKEQKFNHIVDLQEQNLNNFAKYIKNNQMPNKEYEQYTKKISNYMIATYQTNQRALNLDEDASLKDIFDVNKDKAIANGREQAKIEKFLKEKNIKIIAFDK